MTSSHRGQPVGSFQPNLSPGVRWLLIALGAMYVIQRSCAQFAGVALEPLLGFSPDDLMRGRVWQLFTYPFLHGSLTHLFFNAVVLYMLGAQLELRWGTKKFLKFYAVCAVGGALLQTLVWAVSLKIAPNFASYLGAMPTIGASGALYGLFMAFGYLYSDELVLVFFVLPMKARYFVMVLFFIEIVSAVFNSAPGADGGVAHLVHIGGLITGFIYLRVMGQNLDGRGGGMLRRKNVMGRDEVKRRLSLIVNNDDPGDDGKGKKYPITWN